jgi:hypothetical protein
LKKNEAAFAKAEGARFVTSNRTAITPMPRRMQNWFARRYPGAGSMLKLYEKIA